MSRAGDTKRAKAAFEFLRSYIELGARTPLVTARALFSRFRRARSPLLRKVLVAKLFAEYASTFEAIGVICLYLRRRSSSDFLEVLNDYKQGETRKVFEGIQLEGDSFNAMRFLNLPSADDVRKGGARKEVVDAYERRTTILTKRLKEVSDLFWVGDSVSTQIYNKVKHGFAFTDRPELIKEYFQIGDEDWEDSGGAATIYTLPREVQSEHAKVLQIPPAALAVSEAFASKLLRNTIHLTKTLQELLAMTSILNDARSLELGEAGMTLP